MLSRTADHLYWMSRYIERADTAAQLRGAEGKARRHAQACGGVLGLLEDHHAF